MKNIYLDYAATTPLSESMKKYLISMLDNYGNPSSIHSVGAKAKHVIDDARKSVAKFINAEPRDIYFTPSGSAGNTLAIKGLTSDDLFLNKYRVFCSPTAHKSMIKACESCMCNNKLRVNGFGEIDLNYLNNMLEVTRELHPLVCIEAANSEIGTINDVIGIGDMVHRHGGLLIVDATGFIPSFQVNMKLWKKYADIVIFSGHKLGALKGVGVLWKRKGIELKPLVYGTQEQGLVSGTENGLGIASLGKAVAEYDYSSISIDGSDYVYDYILENIPDSYLVGASIDSGNRLPHNLYMCFKGITGESLMIMLDMSGIQVSTGSACNSQSLSASATLSAIGMDEEDMHSCIRMTFGGHETKDELDYVCEKLKECVFRLRSLS